MKKTHGPALRAAQLDLAQCAACGGSMKYRRGFRPDHESIKGEV